MTNEQDSKFDDPRRKHDDAERWASAHRRGNFLTGICIVLAAAIVGLVWYAYPMLKTHDASLRDLPSLKQRFDQTVGSIDNRLKESSNAQQSLRNQVTDVSRDLRARIETVSKQAGQSTEDAYRKLRAQFEDEMKTQADRLANVTERVSGLESSRDGDRVQIAQLKQELNQVREQAERQSDDLAQVRRQMETRGADESQQIEALRRDQDRDRQNIDSVSNQIAVEKVPFEAPKNHNRELTDGITLHIDSTNPAYRLVSGWMWVASDHRSIWLRNQSAQEPVIFYGNQDGQKRELVITNVNQDSVTGYLLLPKQARQTATLGDDVSTGGAAQ